MKTLGYIIENSKIKMDKSKIDSIVSRKEPKNVKEVQVFFFDCVIFIAQIIKDNNSKDITLNGLCQNR